jgi:hypothetical protein
MSFCAMNELAQMYGYKAGFYDMAGD